MGNPSPSMDAWLKEAKADPSAPKIGMYLTHNGVVRQSPKALVRQGDTSALPVKGMLFSYDRAGVEAAIAETYRLPGVYYVRVWLNEGELQVGDDIMYVLLGGDIRPHVIDALRQEQAALDEQEQPWEQLVPSAGQKIAEAPEPFAGLWVHFPCGPFP